MSSLQPAPLSVSELTRRLKAALQAEFRDIFVVGEISSLTRAGSGHIYLTLSDEDAQLRGVIWRRTASQLKFDLAEGMQVACLGSLDIYPPRGTYQITITVVEPVGVGAQQLALKQLHARLAAEGLFDAERKQPIPRFPKRIAVVTSPTGAAVHDFLNVLQRRWPLVDVLIIPSRVQGEGAAAEIAQGIHTAASIHPPVDTLVVTRGGGSAEDLFSFNDESVVRAIAACPIPVISGVGHEIDVTLCDLVADLRALTPSEAAERVAPELADVIATLERNGNRLRSALRGAVGRSRQRLQALQSRRVFAHPLELLATPARRVDDLATQLNGAVENTLQTRRHEIALISERLQAQSPLGTLARGYSVAEDHDGKTIRSIHQVKAGDPIRVRVRDGLIRGKIEETEEQGGAL